MSAPSNRRILLVDDMPAIHADFRKILVPQGAVGAELGALEDALFGQEEKAAVVAFELDSAYQGQEGLALVQASLAADRPYAMAFVDMRMPPGWDGVETIERLWQADARLQVVICTAYSDTSWDDILARLDVRDRLLILKKPFDAVEVCQLANTLTAKWQMTQNAAAQLTRLEDAVNERTRELTRANEALQSEIGEREHVQGQLAQSEKLASIGQLAAGVAHEINNPIGYIFSNFGTLEKYLGDLFEMVAGYEAAEAQLAGTPIGAQLKSLRERCELDFLKEDIPTLMAESKEGITRVRTIVQGLKDFSRVDAHQEWGWANLNQGIDSTLNIVNNEIKYKADVVKEYGVLPDVYCLPSELNQVFMNLLVNAAHAITVERGLITIRTGADAPAATVWIEVADNGCGIPKENLLRIFDPFFTTKPVGKGTGLGLSQVHGFAHQAGGTVKVTSELGKGTKIAILLPRKDVDLTVGNVSVTESGGSGTVLLVDDNPEVAA
ncbi:MAG TPA: ATP-binding protein, partial [Burkholderiaceae bacterium]|nr:ATP-binding protein [Burkholderiaceae bacterium]